jgi:hypothetical protein
MVSRHAATPPRCRAALPVALGLVEELAEAAAWIRQRSRQLRAECGDASVPCVDVGGIGFEAAMVEARRQLLGLG